MYQFFESFLKKMVTSFRRIASATKNEMTVGDLQNEAWVIAHEIGTKRGREIDFSDPIDEDLIIRAVNHRTVKRGDWRMRRAVRIDQESDDEGTTGWSERLAAQSSSDPLISLLLCESEINAQAILESSYSQATAYVMIYVRFGNNRRDICSYLVISNGTLARRVTFAAESVKIQPSLFDGIEKISKDFIAKRGCQYASRTEQNFTGTQWAWEF